MWPRHWRIQAQTLGRRRPFILVFSSGADREPTFLCAGANVGPDKGGYIILFPPFLFLQLPLSSIQFCLSSVSHFRVCTMNSSCEDNLSNFGPNNSYRIPHEPAQRDLGVALDYSTKCVLRNIMR